MHEISQTSKDMRNLSWTHFHIMGLTNKQTRSAMHLPSSLFDFRAARFKLRLLWLLWLIMIPQPLLKAAKKTAKKSQGPFLRKSIFSIFDDVVEILLCTKISTCHCFDHNFLTNKATILGLVSSERSFFLVFFCHEFF